jgi:hypothetical protein
MKNPSRKYGKKRETLPLEGGGKRVGVNGLTCIARRLKKHSTDTEGYLRRYLRNRQIEEFKFRRQQLLPLTLTLSRKGRGKITFDNTGSSERGIANE